MGCGDSVGKVVNLFEIQPQNTRLIDSLIVHCSATPYGAYFDATDIHGWHTSPPNEWKAIGYHYVILLDGTIQKGRIDEEVGAHAKDYNDNSLGICLIGGTDDDGVAYDDGYTKEQYRSLLVLLQKLKDTYEDSVIIAHKELKNVNKACPCLSKTNMDLIRNLIY
jgi:N-acetylmuramoyl-L-alanine amidase